MNCSQPPAGAAQVAIYGSFLEIVPSNVCPFSNQAEFGGPNPASRVRLTPTAAVTIRSMLAFGDEQLELPFTYRLTSSSGAAANVTFTSTVGVFNFDAPVPIPAGGHATLELVQGVPAAPMPWDYDSWPTSGVRRLSEELSISSCKYSFLDTGSTNPASQTAPGINCAGGLVASAPWVAPTSPTYGLNCTDPADEVGPPQIHTTIGAYSDGLALVPSDSCTPNWADFYGRGGLATNNPAARVTITPTNASAPILLRSLYVDLLGTGVAADQPFTFRLAASSGQAVEVFVSAQIADDGYGAVDFPTPLLIPAGGNATVELIDAVPKYPQPWASTDFPVVFLQLLCECEVAACIPCGCRWR